MIEHAKVLGGLSAKAEGIRYEIGTAEELGTLLSPPVEAESVDLITAATAAHWFDMSRFWVQASCVLKPSGTVALWCQGPISMHPSMPNAAEIQQAMDEIQD